MNMDELTAEEKRIISAFRSVNRDGKESLLRQASLHAQYDKFQSRYTITDGIAYINADARQDEPQQ